MNHTIIVWRKSKERIDGKFKFNIQSRYTLTEEELCETETQKFLEDNLSVDENKYEYWTEVEETIY